MATAMWSQDVAPIPFLTWLPQVHWSMGHSLCNWLAPSSKEAGGGEGQWGGGGSGVGAYWIHDSSLCIYFLYIYFLRYYVNKILGMKKKSPMWWLHGSVGSSIIPYTKRLWA